MISFEIWNLINQVGGFIKDRGIQSSDYDLGHAFSTSGGGLAALESLCDDSFKADGVTALQSLVGKSNGTRSTERGGQMSHAEKIVSTQCCLARASRPFSHPTLNPQTHFGWTTSRMKLDINCKKSTVT